METRRLLASFTVASGNITDLISDINTANTSGQANTISLGAGTYTFTSANNNTFGPNALPEISSNLTIIGNGATIERDETSITPLRLFEVASNGTLTLNNLTLANGHAVGGDGGADGTRFNGNGGGGGGLGTGGAIFNSGAINLNGVTLADNTAQGGKGSADPATVAGGSINGGQSAAAGFGNGGNPSSPGYFGGGGGGGKFTTGGGSTNGQPGGFGGGSGANPNNSYGGGNGGGGAGMGGAIFNFYGLVNVTNSTFFNNRALGGAGGNVNGRSQGTGGDGLGGAIFNLNGTLVINTSTLSANTVTGGTGAATGDADGGAVYNLAWGPAGISGAAVSTTKLTDSILANTNDGDHVLVNQEVDSNIATVSSGGPNIVVGYLNVPPGDSGTATLNSSSFIAGVTDGNLRIADSLTDNAGRPATLRLAENSPALFAGAYIPAIQTDEVGNPRTLLPDLGAAQHAVGDYTITVNDTTDTTQNNPANVIAPGQGSTANVLGSTITLRDAINAANNTGGHATIDLADTTYAFNAADNNWYGPNALPAITSDITINGNGATIQRDGSLAKDTAHGLRFFYVSGGLSGLDAGILTLNNLTLKGGYAKGGDSGGGGAGLGAGGAIFNQGTLNINGVTLTNNSAVGGSAALDIGTINGAGMGQDAQDNNGGGFGGGFSGFGGNGAPAQGDLGGGGGGFSADGFGTNGGGLSGLGSGAHDGGEGGNDFSTGDGATGGGNFGAGSAFGEDNAGGGGVGGGGGGAAIGQGGGGGFGGGGGNDADGGFGAGGGNDKNIAHGGAAGFGGGHGRDYGGGGAGMGGAIFSMYGSVTIVNSTITANAAIGGNSVDAQFQDGASGGSAYGGGIFNLDGQVKIVYGTIAGNTVTAGNGDISDGSADGGGIYNLAYGNTYDTGAAVTATTNITNSILINTLGDSVNDLVIKEFDGNNAANTGNKTVFHGSGKNLVANTLIVANGPKGSVTFDSAGSFLNPGNVPFGVASTLADNGGPTKTLALSPTSPVIDKASDVAGITTDQRGVVRPAGSADIGAYEVVNSLVVTTNTDEDNGSSDPLIGAGTSLREAINYANTLPNGTPANITFDPTVFNAQKTITLTSLGTLVLSNVNDPITITGPAAGVTIEGFQSNGFGFANFTVNSGTTAKFSGLTITKGAGGIYSLGLLTLTDDTLTNNFGDYTSGSGGAIYSAGGTLNLTNCTVTGNSAKNGGGIATTGELTIDKSTISNNTATFSGGGIYGIGGATITITDSTIAGNSAGRGGAIFASSTSTGVTLTLTNCTIAYDSAPDGSALYLNGDQQNVTDCTIVGNPGANLIDLASGSFNATDDLILDNRDNSIVPTSGSHNIIDLAGGKTFSDYIAVDALGLPVLADNGGPTQTVALAGGGPAIGAGIAVAGITTDQRGLLRHSTPDIGAYEHRNESLVVTTPTDEDNGTSDPGFGDGTSLREAINYANTLPGGTPANITFDPTKFATAKTITLSSLGTLTLGNTNDRITITGSAAGVTIDGANVYEVFKIDVNTTASINNLTIAHGHDSGGGGLFNGGTLTLSGDTFFQNTSSDAGGAIWTSTALAVINCTFYGNSATNSGGGLFTKTASLVTSVTNSTFSGNSALGGGGIAVYHGGPITLNNVIVAGNTGTQEAPDVAATVSGSNNLIGDGTSTTGISNNDANHNQVGTAASKIGPKLEALADNGGPTQTMALQSGSSAINKGSNAAIPADVTTDQRGPGFDRTIGGIVDIGAFESTFVPSQAVDDDNSIEVNETVSGGTTTVTNSTIATGNLLANDKNLTVDPSTITKVADANNPAGVTPNGSGVITIAGAYGTLVLQTTGAHAGDYSYSLNSGAVPPVNAVDTFTYTLTGSIGNSSIANLTVGLNVTVVASNHPPVAKADSASTTPDKAVTINVLSNDTDADHDTLTINKIVTAPANGVASIVNNKIVYTPTTGFHGNDTLVYQVSDGKGGFDTAKVTITVGSGVGVGPSQSNPSLTDLDIVGTSGNDNIQVKYGGAQGKVTVFFGSTNKGTFNFTGRILIFGLAGNDMITVDSKITRSAFIFGDAGNDTANGGGGADMIFGGDGDDKLFGNDGRDMLFGGDGADALNGGGGDDVLVPGETLYDSNLAAITAWNKEWNRTDASYPQRVGDLASGAGFAGGFKLTKGTTFSASSPPDNLTGGSGRDLFYYNPSKNGDKITDLVTAGSLIESVVVIGTR